MSPDNPITARRAGRPKGPEQLCTVEEVSDALRVPIKTIYGWLGEMCSDKKPLLPHKKLGNKVRIRLRDVDALETRLKLRTNRRPPLSFFSQNDADAGGVG